MPLPLIAGYHLAQSSLSTDDLRDTPEDLEPEALSPLDRLLLRYSGVAPKAQSPVAARSHPRVCFQDDETRILRSGSRTRGSSTRTSNASFASHVDPAVHGADVADKNNDPDDSMSMWAMLDEQVQAECFDEAMNAAASQFNAAAEEQQQATAALDDAVITHKVRSLSQPQAASKAPVLDSPVAKKSRRRKPLAMKVQPTSSPAPRLCAPHVKPLYRGTFRTLRSTSRWLSLRFA